jgi:hypothetical protein
VGFMPWFSVLGFRFRVWSVEYGILGSGVSVQAVSSFRV